jgi:acyl-[acyl-carrier-protein]-phospholipid O-acyltransferase/long-chain-fatty-acid--[acyl-carrier-protein] ligase
VPQYGPALLVSNHVSLIDGFLIGACMQRFVRYMVYETWYDRFAKPLSWIHAIRVPVGTRRSVLKTIELARQELQAGHVVCIFAEGSLTLSGNIAGFQRGLERIVDGLDVPVIPVHLGGVWGSIFSRDPRASLWNSIKKLRFPVTISFGDPMKEPAAFDVRQRVLELAADGAQYSIDPCDTLAKQFIRTAKRNWSHRAMIDSTGRILTYGEALIASRLLAETFRNENQKMVGVLLPASIGAALANLGLVLSGHVPVNLNFTSGRDALNSAVEQCGLKTIITSKLFLAKGKIEQRPEMIFLEDRMQFGKAAKLMAFLRMRLLPVRLHRRAEGHPALAPQPDRQHRIRPSPDSGEPDRHHRGCAAVLSFLWLHLYALVPASEWRQRCVPCAAARRQRPRRPHRKIESYLPARAADFLPDLSARLH